MKRATISLPGDLAERVESEARRRPEKPQEIPCAKLFEDPGMVPAQDMDQVLARDWPDDIDRDRG